MNKFRAWNKERKEYVTQDFLDQLFLRMDGHVIWYSYAGFEDVTDKFDIEFAADKKDKNGKEIFAGDRIEFIPIDGSTKVRQIAEVYYDENRTAFCVKSEAWNCPLSFCKEIEIIGNIHENRAEAKE